MAARNALAGGALIQAMVQLEVRLYGVQPHGEITLDSSRSAQSSPQGAAWCCANGLGRSPFALLQRAGVSSALGSVGATRHTASSAAGSQQASTSKQPAPAAAGARKSTPGPGGASDGASSGASSSGSGGGSGSGAVADAKASAAKAAAAATGVVAATLAAVRGSRLKEDVSGFRLDD